MRKGNRHLSVLGISILTLALLLSMYPAAAIAAEEAAADEGEAVQEEVTQEETPQEETAQEPAGPVQEEDGAYFINFNEIEVEEAAQLYADLDGTDIKLRVQGSSWDVYEFLQKFSFHSIELEMINISSFGDGEFRLADLQGLISLTIPDASNYTFDRDDVFAELTDLTLLHDYGGSCSMLGEITSRQMPSLKHLRLQFDSAEIFDGVMDSLALELMPDTLESLELEVDGQVLDPEEIGPQTLDPEALGFFLGILLRCCPSVTVNGQPLTELPALKDKSVDMDQVKIAAASSYACSVFDRIKHGSMEGMAEGMSGAFYGKLLFADFWYEKLEDLSARSMKEEDGYRDHYVPDEMLAEGLEDADFLILLYNKDTKVGFYSYGGGAYQVDTMMVAVDLNSGVIYKPYTVASNDPPNTITVTTINGIPTGGSGYGDYEPLKALDLVLSVYNSSMPGKADQPATEPETQESAADDAAADQPAAEDAAAAAPVDEAFLNEVLAALDDPVYQQTLEALRGGETIVQGTYNDTAGGLQHMLVDFGCDIAIDNSAGPGTFGALQQVLGAFGKGSAETVDAALFEEMLPLLLLSKDQDENYADLLQSHFGSADTGEYQYLKGCAYYASENYYRALLAFEQSGYGDYEERMAACDQGFPQNGEIWHNSSVYGTDMYLTFTVNSKNEESGMCFEVYTEDHTLASILFLKGSGSVTTKLPGGAYRIKDATGFTWYGWKDAFGKEGSYEFMNFKEYEEDDYLTWLGSGYEWTITVNVTETTPESTGVGSDESDWETWATR